MNQPIGHNDEPGSVSVKRELDRDSLFLKATLRFQSNGEEGEVRIRNLSAGGLMAEAPIRVARGEKLEINLRSIGWISGSVAWVTEGRIGISFDHPIDPKAARNTTSTSHENEVPLYLQKLNKQTTATQKSLRRI
jgi:hypothetical protein